MTTRENSLWCIGWVKCVLMLASITSLLIFIKLSLTTSRKFSIAVVAHPVEPVEEAEDWIALSPQEWSSLGTHTIADNIGLWERWIVVYSTQAAPSPWLHELSKQSQWKMVVVADNDEQEPAWLGATCIFLSLEKQDRLGYEITKLLPMHHHSRKNIGYLFAIHHGATAIYDIDHMDNSSLDFLSSHLQPFVQSQILFVSDRDPVAAISNNTSSSGKMVNIYQHFGQGTVWPLGFPVEEISAPLRRAHYDQKSNVNVGVQQNLINGETDVDSIFRLTRKNRGQSLQVYFDMRADFVGLPQFSFCPFSGQNAIINSVAFWSLVIPTSFSNRLASTFRSYWMQRLLWDVGAAVTFGPPTIDRQRNVTNTKQDFDRQEYILEQTFIAKASQLVQFLADWKSDQPFFFNRVDELCHDLAEQGFWSIADALVCRAWLKDLVRVGFKSPLMSQDLAVINYDETLTEWFKPPFTSKGCSNCFVPLELPTTYLHYDTQSSVLVRLKYFLPPEIVLYTITFSGRHKLVKLMKNTWGQLVQNFIVYSSSNDPSVPTIMVKPDNPTWKTSCTNCRQSYCGAPA